jgi:hypothetical protein
VRYAQNDSILTAYSNWLRERGRVKSDLTRQAYDAVASQLIRHAENEVAPLATNPLAGPGALQALENALPHMGGTSQLTQLTATSGFLTWARNDPSRLQQQPVAATGSAQLSWTDVRMPKLDHLSPAHQQAARNAVAFLNRHGAARIGQVARQITVDRVRGYMAGLRRLEQLRLPARVVEDSQLVPDVDLAMALQAFGQPATDDPQIDRQALVDLAVARGIPGQPHPAQLSLDIFLQLPASLQNALFEGSSDPDRRMRLAFNLVHGLNVQGSAQATYEGRLSVHEALSSAMDDDRELLQQARSVARRAMAMLDEHWNPLAPRSLLDVARNPRLMPTELRDRLHLHHGRARTNWQSVLDWINGQDDNAPDTSPQLVLQENTQWLRDFTAQAGAEADEASAVVLEWMRNVETGLRNTQLNPVRQALLDAGGDEQRFVRDAGNRIRAARALDGQAQGTGAALTDRERRHLGALYRWWTATQGTRARA